MEEVRVIGFWSSPYVYRVTWALKLKGVEYEYQEEDIYNKSDLLLQYNPVHKKVPVFIHGGKPIVESGIILEYMDEIWPQNPLFPTDPHAKAMARFWTKFVDDKSFIGFYKRFGEEKTKAIKESQECLKILEDHSPEKKKFFDGDKIGMTDLALGLLAFWFEAMEEAAGVQVLEADSFPRLHAWIRNFKEVTVIKENHPDQTRLVAYFKMLREKFTKPRAALFGFFVTEGEEQVKATKEGQEQLRILEEHGLGDKKFFGGDEIGMTDLEFGWLAWWLDVMSEVAGVRVIEAESYPRLHAWIQRFKEFPTIKETLPDRSAMLTIFEGRRAAFLALAKS